MKIPVQSRLFRSGLFFLGGIVIAGVAWMTLTAPGMQREDPLKWLNAILAALGMLAMVALAMTVYMLPTIIAALRNHPNGMSILIVNAVLGFTFVAWVGTLAWAYSGGGE